MSGHHVISIKTCRNVLIGLLFLTVLTVAVAKPVSGFDAGILNWIIAIGIASMKAFLVMAFFMQLKYDNKLYMAIILSTVLFLGLLFGIVMIDWSTRMNVINTL